MSVKRIILRFFVCFLLLSGTLCAENLTLLPKEKIPEQGWNVKPNVKRNWNAEQKILSVEIDPSEFSFGWFQIPMPQMDYAGIAGIYGQFRIPEEDRGRHVLNAMLLFPQSGAPTEYYQQEAGNSRDCRGEWVEFFLPFKSFLPQRDTKRSQISGEMFQRKMILEVSISGVFQTTRVEFQNLTLVTADEEMTLARRVNRSMYGRLLRNESEIASDVHPRLLLHGDRLAAIRAQGTDGAEKNDAYRRLIVLADGAMKKIDPEKPFAPIFAYERNGNLTEHQNRGHFEGTLNPIVIPLETLAAAAVITKNDVYGRHAARALVNMARSLDVNSPEINQGFYYTRTFYVRALALGYDWLYDWLTPEERRDVKITLLGFVQDIYAHSWTDGWGRHPLNRVWNWDPGLVSCAGLGVMALQGETWTEEDAMLIQFRRHLRDYLTFGIDFDGCGHEGPSYLSYGIGAGVPFAECLRDAGYGDLFTETNWQNIAQWIVAEMLPNQPRWNNLSDCNHGAPAGCPVYAYTCGRLAELARTDPVRPGEKIPPQENTLSGMDYVQHFRETPGPRRLSYGAMAELMGWAWNAGEETAPDAASFSDAQTLAYLLFYAKCPRTADPGTFLPESQFFRGRGLVVLREGGYSKDAFHLEIEAGPHAAGHDQCDKGTFTLRAFGQNFVIDSGYGNDSDPLKSTSSFAHNVVLIDGEGQPMKNHNCSSGEITGYTHRPEYDWVRTDARDAWNVFFGRWKGEPTGMNVEKADRHYLFVHSQNDRTPSYIVTYDDFQKQDGQEHDFTWQLHTDPSFQFVTDEIPWKVRQNQDSFQVLTSPKEKVPGAAHGQAVFTLTAPEDGKFTIAGMIRCAGLDAGKSDSFFVRINGEKLFTWDLTSSSSFTLCGLSDRDAGEISLELKAGEKVQVELTAREPEAQLAFFGLRRTDVPNQPLEGCVLASEAVQNPKNPFILCDSVTEKTDAEMLIFPFADAPGKTETDSFLTSQTGSHPRLMYTVRAVNPHFLMVLVPRSDQTQPLPVVQRLQTSDGGVSLRLTWPTGKTDTIRFIPGQNGKVPTWERK